MNRLPFGIGDFVASFKGEAEGHPFRGNQYDQGSTASGVKPISSGMSPKKTGGFEKPYTAIVEVSDQQMNDYMDKHVKVSVEKESHEAIRGQNMAQGSAAGGGFSPARTVNSKKIVQYRATAEYKIRNPKSGNVELRKQTTVSQDKQTAMDSVRKNVKSLVRSGVEQGIDDISNLD